MIVVDELINDVTQVDFACENISAYTVKKVTNYPIKERSIIVNMGDKDICLDDYPKTVVPPRKSTIVRDKTVEAADLLLVIEVHSKENMGRVILNDEWDSVQDLFGSDLDGVPLWRSPQIEIGEITFNPFTLSDELAEISAPVLFKIKVNIWFAPEKVDCFIHNKHDFVEFHTQISGMGRMQKFETDQKQSLYQDVLLVEGNTHDLFCAVTGKRESFEYPWHQYYSDTDCVWMATELHPVS